MGILFKIIIILGLIFLITGMFTKSKAERVARRNRTTNMLLIAIVVLLAVSIGINVFSRFYN
jgi:putative Mn2+ efflux pump MntP